MNQVLGGDEECSLSVEGTYAVSEPGGPAVLFNEAPQGASALTRLLGRKVSAAAVLEAGTLRIEFNDGAAVEVHNSGDHYESYQLSLGTRVVIV